MVVRVSDIRDWDADRPITMLTAYDAPTASIVDDAEIDMILVGDSVGNTMLGYDSTLPVTVDEMVSHTAAVARGAERAMVVGDMPFGSFGASVEQTVENALVHTDVAEPRVSIVVESEDQELTIEVRDDGPGIPDREVSVLLDGEEQPLRHGSGLGLWIVSWGAVSLGGDLSLAENEPRGTVVSLRLPARR